MALAVAVQVGAGAYGIAAQTTAGLAVVLAGAAVFLGVAALVLVQFRRANGVRLDGLASTIVLGTGTMSTLRLHGHVRSRDLGRLRVAFVARGDRGRGGWGCLLPQRFSLVARLPSQPGRAGGWRLPATLALLALAACVGFAVLIVGS